MKKLLLTLLTVIVTLTVSAERVSKQEALLKAQQFMPNKKFGEAKSFARGEKVDSPAEYETFYIFNAENKKGFVIVSGDDRTREILGYSSTGTLDMDSLPANLQWWLDEYARQIDALGTSTVAVRSLTLSTASAISPLIQTGWAQGAPYNYMCPDDNGKDYYESDYNVSNICLTGCVATAMAQVMNYWKWPESCPALEAYSTSRFNVKSLPSTNFKWDLMKESYSWGDRGDAGNAVAELMRYCGQAVKMGYRRNGSSSGISKDVMVNTFNYSPSIAFIWRDNYNLEAWENIIYNELAEGRPVLYGGETSDGAGHQFIVDGYSSDGLFHINWGWGGRSLDIYFVLSAADEKQPGVDGASSNKGYRYRQHAMVGIKPFREGEMEPYALLSDDGLTVTFHYDGHMISRKGIRIDWYNGKEQTYKTATTAVFDESFADYYPYDNFPYAKSLFSECNKLKEIKGISNLNTDNMTYMDSMFDGCSSLTSLDLSGFKTDNVTSMGSMFKGCSSLMSLNLSGFKTDNVTSMWGMFFGCSNLTNLDVSGFKTDNVTSMRNMFLGCSSLTILNVSGFKTDNVTDMGNMFWGCSGLTSLNLSGFKTDNVTNMNSMFDGCSSLMSLNLSGFKTDNVTNMGGMFASCSSLTNIDLSGFNTNNVTNVGGMFMYCSELTNLDLSGFKTAKVTSMDNMFMYCPNLTTIYVGYGWSTDKVEGSSSMFYGNSKLVGGQGTEFDYSYTDHTYARVDGGVDSPGYFTFKRVKGDANGDGELSETDRNYIVRHILGDTPDDFDEEAANLNGDDKIDVSDIVILNKRLSEQ